MAVSVGLVVGLIKALASVDPAAITSAVDAWLDAHPEATTTVEDGSITEAKLASALAALINGKQEAPGSTGSAGQVLGLDSNLDPAWLNRTGSGVDDVKIDGASIVSGGIATIPQAGNNVFGVVKKGETLTIEETVSGSTPSITGAANHRYICGEVSELSIVAPESGIVDVVFTSGSTPTVLTVTSAKTGVSAILWANGFDPTSLEANTTYELNILDGEFGVVGSWT